VLGRLRVVLALPYTKVVESGLGLVVGTGVVLSKVTVLYHFA
jgi:hypothetical protein